MKKGLIILAVLSLFSPSFVVAQKSNDPKIYQWAYNHVGVYEAWDYTVGSKDVIVAIIDNGFDTFHPDLRSNVWKNFKEIPGNQKDDDKNGYVDDVYGWNFVDNNNDPRPDVENVSDSTKQAGIFNHGTLVAGLIGGVGDNNMDGAGINWQVSLMNLKVLGNGGNGSLEGFSDAVHYAVDNGADIINISMVGDFAVMDFKESVEYAYKNNVLIVAAAGNDASDLNKNPLYPICADAGMVQSMVLGVSAVNQDHRIATFSNYGSSCVDITAPGQGLNSLVRFSPTNGLNDHYSDNWNGTSFAAPLVSGAAALIKSLQPSWGPKEIFNAITSTVHHTPSEDEVAYANLFGAGLLQIDKAVMYAFEQLKFSQAINTVLVFDNSSGQVDEHNILKNDNKEYDLNVLKGVDSVVSFLENGQVKFMTAKYENKKIEIKIFDGDWQKLDTWSISSAGPMGLAVGDVRGDEGLEIVLYPQYNDKQIYVVYSLEGAYIQQYSDDTLHKGVKLAIGGDKQLVTFYNSQVKIFENNKIINEFNVDLPSVGQLGAGDIDGDGQIEYIFTPDAGDETYLMYYNQDGKLKRNFKAYDSDYRGGLNLAIGDYNSDGQSDVVVSPVFGNLPVRVWSGKVKKLAEWKGLSNSNDIKLLLY